ncbi:uncharacterized protein BO80DRAFT_11295 [Aspergillus ibericus CBS 121593]|uniref:Uncharacterized protein n=1 Tax=Aspergillus ibericus CBS 121593 TaxID=1448316 RepID=A0A395HHE7_9EURO|nr:hypothetical protein BO80DRAFT_11295 [Aspergillus ibericus CBS 121593]RAL06398.1 hypothetical protein BO80DRAFT_11295 [Aspergillus ibericus CBS 121593]
MVSSSVGLRSKHRCTHGSSNHPPVADRWFWRSVISGSSRPGQCKRSANLVPRLASVHHNSGYLLLCPTSSQPRVAEGVWLVVEAGRWRGSVHFRPGGAVSSPTRPSIVDLSLLLVADPRRWIAIGLDRDWIDALGACWMHVWERRELGESDIVALGRRPWMGLAYHLWQGAYRVQEVDGVQVPLSRIDAR